jgi:hypothetical protein
MADDPAVAAMLASLSSQLQQEMGAAPAASSSGPEDMSLIMLAGGL